MNKGVERVELSQVEAGRLLDIFSKMKGVSVDDGQFSRVECDQYEYGGVVYEVLSGAVGGDLIGVYELREMELPEARRLRLEAEVLRKKHEVGEVVSPRKVL